ncbi:hypothetical protein [Halovenus halobia]|uniref:hypothetical protein n=1 Tax=Halovenus halobia TaxID=3396622 RepID=UPI003F5461B9
MSLRESIRSGRAQYVTLWLLAGVCFVLAATNTAVFGLEQSTLLLLTSVFAAVTAEYDGSRSCPSREPSS